MMSPDRVSHLPDDVVLTETKRLTQREQAAAADVLVMLAEVDSRKLYFVAGYGSLFSYCTDELHLSEDAAYTRIEVARVSRAFPMVLELVAAGALSLTNARLLAPALTPDNHVEALRSACHRRKRDVELLLARLRPQPDVVTMIRKLPAKSRPGTNALFQATLSGSSARQTATAPQPGSGMTAPVASTPS
ncbi:MAG TPA: hypothetical protein VFZ36_13030, partial [Vicinamibacterales bacterium]